MNVLKHKAEDLYLIMRYTGSQRGLQMGWAVHDHARGISELILLPSLIVYPLKPIQTVWSGTRDETVGLNKIYPFILTISSAKKYRKHKSSMLIGVLPRRQLQFN